MATLEIIHLSPEDWPVYKQIRLEGLLSDPQAFGSSYEEVAQRPDAFWQGRLADAAAGEKSWLLFARDNGQIVGTIGAVLNDSDPSPSDNAHIIGVFVSPSARGKGIGAALMAGILKEVTQKVRLKRFTLGVNIHQTAAVSLYQRFGFKITGTRTGLLGDGQSYESYLMEKRI